MCLTCCILRFRFLFFSMCLLGFALLAVSFFFCLLSVYASLVLFCLLPTSFPLYFSHLFFSSCLPCYPCTLSFCLFSLYLPQFLYFLLRCLFLFSRQNTLAALHGQGAYDSFGQILTDYGSAETAQRGAAAAAAAASSSSSSSSAPATGAADATAAAAVRVRAVLTAAMLNSHSTKLEQDPKTKRWTTTGNMSEGKQVFPLFCLLFLFFLAVSIDFAASSQTFCVPAHSCACSFSLPLHVFNMLPALSFCVC